MSGKLRGVISNHAHAALRRWPKDPLRPDCQLQDALAKRVDRPTGFAPPATGATTQEQADLKQINALYSLLEDRYKTMYRAPESIMKPKSNPDYYQDLVKELEEAPNRTFLQRMGKKFGGMLRFT
ncbi:hypothetical protein B0J18DRAFT_460218 [Chaetomium sp. MPI-SDFR-AT-0129]|nr:hypothetical protein B0J18DRAFT_460218 [Chaetomium sp. MPI-SDFR-AT-0129]